MNLPSRRRFISAGLVALGTGGLVSLRACAEPTPASGALDLEEQNFFGLKAGEAPSIETAGGPKDKNWAPTADNILGPYYREGAPYRAKVTPPQEPGQVLLIKGMVWAHDSRKPLPGAIVDVWQANDLGRYDNDDPKKPPAKGVFENRARMITDEGGRYEFESILPGRYKIGPKAWRPRHIHYLVRHPGYDTLVTQLYFKGDPHNETDRFIKKSLIIETSESKSSRGKAYLQGRFDIVLAKSKKTSKEPKWRSSYE